MTYSGDVTEALGLHRRTPAELKAVIEAQRAGTAFLEYRDGDEALRIVPLGPEQDRLSIGRLPACEVVRVGRTQLVFHAGGDDDLRRTTPALDRVAPNPTDSQRKVLVELCRPALERGGGAASNREIAAALFVSVETVKTHMRALFDAFDVGDVPQYHKRTELVRRALETGVVSIHDLESPR